jgi:SIR2-like domain
MLMVIFGAGASYDSLATHPPGGSEARHHDFVEYRPPLADYLFEDRPVFNREINDFPVCKPIVNNLRHLNGRPIEQVLQNFQSEAARNPRRHQQLAAVRYYLQSVLWNCGANWQQQSNGVTNYLTLIDQIEHWRLQQDEAVALVTFNYDALLEDALSDFFGLKIKQIDDYVDGHPRYSIFKLHGSVNWAREVAAGLNLGPSPDASQIAGQCIENAAHLSVSSKYALISSCPAGLVNGLVPAFPAIAIPVESKNQFECPPRHLEKLKGFLPDVRKLLIIGWRGMETHFMDLLRFGLRPPLDIMIVSKIKPRERSDAEDLRARIRASLAGTVQISDDSFRLWERGFSGLVTSCEVNSFL